jgi:Tol biopolymer transport system component
MCFQEVAMRTIDVRAVLAMAVPWLVVNPSACRADDDRPQGTIAFSSLAPRGWDIYITDLDSLRARRLTDHPALDFNAAFSPVGDRIAFVSERDGNQEIYTARTDGTDLKRLTDNFALDDRPAWSPDGRRIAYSSTRQPAQTPGRAWNAIYVADVESAGDPRRLTPPGIADYSPTWSHDGRWIAVASGTGEDDRTDICVMAPDGTSRRTVIANGGWPAFSADGGSIFFHSKRGGKWGIWRIGMDGSGLERITPPDSDAFTPSTSRNSKMLVASIRRGASRQIVLIDPVSCAMTELTDPYTDHWNPSFAPDGKSVVYHQVAPHTATPNVEVWGAPSETSFRMFRLAGAFPAFSPDGRRVALTGGGFGRLDVMNSDGTERKTLHEGTSRGLFSVSWAHHGDRIAFSLGPVFQGPGGQVDIVAVRPDGSDKATITHDPGNDGFPAFSPDGKQLVFRSGRGGSKNLYVMDVDGSNVRRLTEGNWTDTMCDWSPTGEWITFASDRDKGFEVWLVRPDGSDLHKIVAGGGRNNHPHFSPDGKWIVFTSKRAGLSAEPISLPSQPQPYGDLFAIRVDGTGLIRLTHNGFEEGTPAWGPVLDIKVSGAVEGEEGKDY